MKDSAIKVNCKRGLARCGLLLANRLSFLTNFLFIMHYVFRNVQSSNKLIITASVIRNPIVWYLNTLGNVKEFC